MPNVSQKVRAYLEKLEAERTTVLAISKEKAEEAKLIKARQEGFQEAFELIGVQTTDTECKLQSSEAPRSTP